MTDKETILRIEGVLDGRDDSQVRELQSQAMEFAQSIETEDDVVSVQVASRPKQRTMIDMMGGDGAPSRSPVEEPEGGNYL